MADKKISQLPAATLPLAGTELLPIVQSGTTDNITVNNLAVGNLKSNATTGVLQVTGPADASTRVMTTPDANFTIARTDTGQTFTGTNIFGAATTTARTVNIGGSFAVERFGATPQIEMLGGTNSTVGYSYRININQSNWTLTNAVIGSGQANIISIDNATKDVAVSTGNLVIGTSGKGIDFSATAGTGTSELLADYEEGTWTPAASFSVSNGDLSYARQIGRYIKTGSMVTVFGWINFTETTASGTLSITGLPYASANITNLVAGGGLPTLNMTGLAGGGFWSIAANSSTINVYQGRTGDLGTITEANTSAGSGFYFSCSYQAA